MRLKALSKLVAAVVMCSSLLFSTLNVEAATAYTMPTNSSFKSYMSFKTITSVNSRQYKLQEQCVTNELGFRVYDGRYTVAIGTGFNAVVGDYIDVTLSTGKVLHCIVGDIKKLKDTDGRGIQAANGNIVEFIVDTDILSDEVKYQGNVSCYEGFEGNVTHITFVDNEMFQENNVEEQTQVWLVVNKYSTALPSGENLYTVEYAYGSDFNSIICSEEYYNSVVVGSTVVSLV